MRVTRLGATVILFTVLIASATPTDSLPPNTVLLSQMMRELSAQPGFTDSLVTELQAKSKVGAALLTPGLVNHLRDLVVGKDWQGLDRFPGWTMSEITPAVSAIDRVVVTSDSATAKDVMSQYLDVGAYPLAASGTIIDFRDPSPLPGFQQDEPVATLADDVVRGDGPGPLAAEHAESQRLADALNRLAANGLDGVGKVTAFWNDERMPSTPEELIEDIKETGQTVTVSDARYFANFGHLHYKGQDVMMPFFVSTGITVPGTRRPLLIPVSHAEYEWHIRGPMMNADVSFYFGIDGKAEFRTMDELDQSWVMSHHAHEYREADAVEVTRLTGKLLQAYLRLHQAHPAMPFGGYFTLGVCQDGIAAIETKLNGTSTLFPTTADDSFFTDPRDAEINVLIHRLPKDRNGAPPTLERVFGSLPVGDSDAELRTIAVPGLANDLVAVHDAWTAGELKKAESQRALRIVLWTAAISALLASGYWLFQWDRRRRIAAFELP